MTISQKIVLFIVVLSLGVLIMLIGSASNGRKVSLFFHGIETNRDGLAARIEFTNSTRRSVSYEGNSYRPEYRLIEASYGGWKERDNTANTIYMGTLANVPRPLTLLPSSGVVFRGGSHLGHTRSRHAR